MDEASAGLAMDYSTAERPFACRQGRGGRSGRSNLVQFFDDEDLGVLIVSVAAGIPECFRSSKAYRSSSSVRPDCRGLDNDLPRIGEVGGNGR